MRSLPLVLALTLCVAPPVKASRNVNGAILVHTDNDFSYTAGSPCEDLPPLGDCEELSPNGTRVDSQVVWLIAAFLPESSPGVTALQFGIEHTFAGSIIDKGPCGPGLLEIPDTDWPEGSGGATGTAIAFSEPVQSRLFAFYWFALDRTGSSNPDASFFSTTHYPHTAYAAFADDGAPPNLDRCYNFGTVRWNGEGENHCPSVLGIGACCLSDHSCVETTEGDCALQGGTYQTDGTTCTPDPCVPPSGACCLSDGSCMFLTEEECAMHVCATWSGASTECAGFACVPPIGACCLDGVCRMLTEVACASTRGSYHCGLTCETDPCSSPPGACCFSESSCVLLTVTQCANQGGSYRGDYVPCEPSNPCAPPPGYGACCFAAGGCDVIDSYRCLYHGGEWRGEGTTCPPQPPCSLETPTGACCFVESRCEVLTFSDCRSQGGWWRGGGTTCPPSIPCPWDPPTGACCLDNNGNCEVMTEAACGAHQGMYWGDDTTCGDAPPCYDVPTKKSTWGGIRLGFR